MVKQTYAQSPKKVPPPRPKTPPNLQYKSDPDLNLTKGSTKSEGQGRSDGADSKKRAAKTTSSTDDTTNKPVVSSFCTIFASNPVQIKFECNGCD